MFVLYISLSSFLSLHRWNLRYYKNYYTRSCTRIVRKIQRMNNVLHWSFLANVLIKWTNIAKEIDECVCVSMYNECTTENVIYEYHVYYTIPLHTCVAGCLTQHTQCVSHSHYTFAWREIDFFLVCSRRCECQCEYLVRSVAVECDRLLLIHRIQYQKAMSIFY